MHSSEEVPYRKPALSIKGALFLLPPLLLCVSPSRATAAEHLLIGVESALAQPSSMGQCIQREYNELLLKQLSPFMTTTFELRAYQVFHECATTIQFIKC